MKRARKNGTSMRNRAGSEAVAGTLASLMSLWVFYPFDVWKTIVQTTPSSSRELLLANNMNSPFPVHLAKAFAGWKMKTLHTASSNFSYFFLYSWLCSQWERRHAPSSTTKMMSVPMRLLLSAIAAMLNTCITLPLDVLSTHHQTLGLDESSEQSNTNHREVNFDDTTQSSLHDGDAVAAYDIGTEKANDYNGIDDDVGTHKQSPSTEQPHRHLPESSISCKKSEKTRHRLETRSLRSYHSVSFLIDEWKSSFWTSDLKSLWRGLIPSLLLCMNPSINHTIFDFLKSKLLINRGDTHCEKSQYSLSILEAFALGLVAKFAATIVTYPLIRVKMILMVQSLSPRMPVNPFTELWQCIRKEYSQDGIKGLYRGCNLQLIHTLLKSALLMMMKERISLMIQELLRLVMKSSSYRIA